MGCPPCAGETGEQLKDSIVDVTDKCIISPQYEGLTGDGVYKHCSVAPKVDEDYRKKGNFTHDLMHLAALVDTAMRNDKAPHKAKFAWLNSLTQVIGAGIRFIQWGKEWKHFFDVYMERIEKGLEQVMRRPKGFSEIREKLRNSEIPVKISLKQ